MVVKIVCPLCGENLSIEDINFTQVPHTFICPKAELQKRADRADQSVLFFLAGANFWEKHSKMIVNNYLQCAVGMIKKLM